MVDFDFLFVFQHESGLSVTRVTLKVTVRLYLKQNRSLKYFSSATLRIQISQALCKHLR